ncbi:hypothetical protein N42HA_00300 [Lactococcus lactis]|nr:hypothetical protein [Lactococcus lactis]
MREDFKKRGNQTPRVRFEALAIGINLALRENPKLSMSQEKARILLESESFKQWTTTDAANNRNKINSRINGVKEFLLTGKIDE